MPNRAAKNRKQDRKRKHAEIREQILHNKSVETSTETKKEGEIMGEISRYADRFLKQGGTSLGYDWKTLPELKDMDDVLQFTIHVWEYQGITESEYYGIDENEGKTMP